VAVVACGPLKMQDDVHNLCAQQHFGIAFDIHEEHFDL
jgi:predicted ferric reductase